MQLTSSRTVPASVETTWAALNDPETLKACIPGCETIERVSEHGGGKPVQAITLSGAWIRSDRTRLDVLSKRKVAWAAIMEPTHVPWG